MKPQHVYKDRSMTGWTRIDMLLALYDAAIERLSLAKTAIESGDDDNASQHLLRGQRIVIEIMGGLNTAYGELPENIQQLCVFVSGCINDRKPKGLEAAIRVLNQLREGFDEIRPHAIELENQGTIPSIHQSQEFHANA